MAFPPQTGIMLVKSGCVGITEATTNTLIHFKDDEGITFPEAMPQTENLPSRQAPSLLIKILAAMFAHLPRNVAGDPRIPRQRTYPTHTFMRPRRRKFKGWMRAATR